MRVCTLEDGVAELQFDTLWQGVERKKEAYRMQGGEWGELRSYRNLRVDPLG